MKKTIFVFAIILTVCALCASLCACTIDDILNYTEYINSDAYTAGDFTYAAQDVTAVEISWVTGEIKIEQPESDTLSVSEKFTGEGTLAKEQQLHWLVENKTLKIHFWKSGFRSKLDGQKNLTVQIPKGVAVTASVVDFDICGADLTLSTLQISAVAGSVKLDGISATKVEISNVSGEITLNRMDVSTVEISGVSGEITVDILNCNSLEVGVVGGNVNLVLPDGGATVKYSSTVGKLKTDAYFYKSGNTYTFGYGFCQVAVSSVAGNLKVTER